MKRPRVYAIGKTFSVLFDHPVGDPDGLFIAYGAQFPDELPTTVKVVGCNMSNPPWLDKVPSHVKVVTTTDVLGEIQNIAATAEHAWGMMLALNRRLTSACSRPYDSRNKWLAPKSVQDMTIGIIGRGRIGGHIARYAAAFNARTASVDALSKYSTLAVADLSDAVFVSVRTPECVVNQDFVDAMKPSALLVSICPHYNVDVRAVVRALRDHRLRGAAFDDWPPNADIDTGHLLGYGRLITTPHIGGSTITARKATENAVLRKMRALLNGGVS